MIVVSLSQLLIRPPGQTSHHLPNLAYLRYRGPNTAQVRGNQHDINWAKAPAAEVNLRLIRSDATEGDLLLLGYRSKHGG